LIISTFGASDMFSIYNLSFVFGNYFLNVMSLNVSLVSIVSVSFIFAMLLKSAQFVFYPWLLDAMEAPVPISAQLHSSTLVIIGFYSALRSWPIISM
jgi:NADH:ubiquinone oxidoreductase subunit 5 (subunit L)/multisubunit Na+/H+ antiporter MnhA subunit